MRLHIPSFRSQIIVLVILLILTSILFFRNYFLESFKTFSSTTETLSTNEQTRKLYEDYSPNLDAETRQEFKEDIESIMLTENQKTINRQVFINELQLYSKFIIFFLTLIVILLFFVSFYFITRPLKRLQGATVQLAKGNLDARVKESPLSPLNDLIVSFNNMAEELSANRKKLIQAEKDAAWRDMARVLAHEIKNPLTPIRLSLERLEMKYAMKSENFDEIFANVSKVIHEEIDKLQSFATEFSNFAKIPVAKMEFYNINSYIEEIVEPYNDHINIQLDLKNNLPNVFADKIQIKQVFDNLIQNSINAASGKLTLEIATALNSAGIQIRFRDNGKGIEKEHLDKIFQPYFTKSEGGTGLGLAIVKRIIENHNASISVNSQVNIGTTFNLFFPLVKVQEN